MLVSDKVSQALGDPQFVEEMIRKGFDGFETLSDAELVQCARDAGVDTSNAELIAHLVLLESLPN
ncbi:hypothetical protein AS149_14750 [Burkholderia cenocepacia]|nr:hypothetical protein AS149_14750 [Burkholderia cenocepacia]